MLAARHSRRGKGQRAASGMTATCLGPTCSVCVSTCASPTGRQALQGRVCGVCESSNVPEWPCCAFLLPRGLWGKRQRWSCPSCPLCLQRGSDPFTSDGHAHLKDKGLEQLAQTTWSQKPRPTGAHLCSSHTSRPLGDRSPEFSSKCLLSPVKPAPASPSEPVALSCLVKTGGDDCPLYTDEQTEAQQVEGGWTGHW